jgi:Zn-dependent protease
MGDFFSLTAPDEPLAAVVRPSPLFLAIAGVFAATGVGLWLEPADPRLLVFGFVLSGWVLALCLHEFGHAAVAYSGGDKLVRYRGYLTLDPLKYTDPLLSIVLPVVFLAIGGIGLPGGAVMIQRGALRSREWAAGMSLAGPLASLAFGLVLLVPFVVARAALAERDAFAAALAFLALLQFYAVVINLLPIPGLDGFGLIEPYLSPDLQRALLPVRQFGFLVLFLIIFRVPAASGALSDATGALLGLADVPRSLAGLGYRLFKFWE